MNGLPEKTLKRLKNALNVNLGIGSKGEKNEI